MIQGFISYCHDDHRSFVKFQTHLAGIERAYGVKFWADTRISAGYYWSTEIEIAIEAADVFLLLLSPGFIASDYIFFREIPAIASRHRTTGALIVPVILERCSWQFVAGALQAVPTEEGRLTPILDWAPQRNGFNRAREQIGAAIERHFGLERKSTLGKATS
ncbi:MAG TPA: toll/interleukin-1 receptor domain-containing protein [Stellaceae bacterium]|nr:toll/interleukin-1 receptor domain-containing protein [Stellaceae bacterium]